MTGIPLDLGGGRTLDLLDPFAFDFTLDDIAGPLSRICRWGGRCSAFYSVAQHSVLVMDLVEASHPALAMHALLHDAGEAFVADVPTPIKSRCRVHYGAAEWSYEATETRVHMRILQCLGLRELDRDERETIADADLIVLHTEARDLMGNPEWSRKQPRMHRKVEPLTPEAAERAFRAAFERLAAAGVGR